MWPFSILKPGRVMRRFKNEQGAILLEALLAVAILAVALTAITQSMLSGLRAAVLSAEYLRAASLLDSVMTEQFLRKPDERSAQAEVKAEVPYERYRYSVRVSDEGDSQYLGLKLKRVECSVIWPAGRGERTMSAALLLSGSLEP
jgi:Tfp pilus assembly protein PilV